MTLPHHPVDDVKWRRSFPEDGEVAGWRFRTMETSAGVYLAEGSDRFGRLVSRRGEDPGVLLAECEKDARDIQRQIIAFADNQAFYDCVALLCSDLEIANHPGLGQRVRAATASGSEAGEILGATRSELRAVRADPALPKSFRSRVDSFIAAIDTAFGGSDRA